MNRSATSLREIDHNRLFVGFAGNHRIWHGPATILACSAGKHVYVEKPCCHNPREGEMQVEAARKYRRVVQVGTQRRSWSGVIEAMAQVTNGVPSHRAVPMFLGDRLAGILRAGPDDVSASIGDLLFSQGSARMIHISDTFSEKALAGTRIGR